MKAFRRPRVTIKSMMIVVAIAAVLLVGVQPLWRYCFASPIRTIVYRVPGQDRPTAVTFDVRLPAVAKELERMRSRFEATEFAYRIARSPVSADDQLGVPRPRASR